MSRNFLWATTPTYRTVWRWHFYAGLYCIPFVLFLAFSGTIYLFKPQIDNWIDRPFLQLNPAGVQQSPAELVLAAEKAFPGSEFRFYEVPASAASAVQVVLLHEQNRLRVYLHPTSLAVLHFIREEDRFMRQIHRLHGELWLGENGSYLVELAACWTIVLVLTGMFLWWPRNATGLAGIVYPRISASPKIFWRDIHSVTGIWVSVLVLILIITGLPWAKFWGNYFRTARQLTHTSAVRQTWSTRSGFRDEPAASNYDLWELNRVIKAVEPLALDAPVHISPPTEKITYWTVSSLTPNRPRRVTMAIDGITGKVMSQHGFADQHAIDKVVSVGIAFHEGQLFGWSNQLLGVLTTSGLVTMCLSGVVLWWRRRPPQKLGAPLKTEGGNLSILLISGIVLLGLLLPLFGVSLIFVLMLDRILLVQLPGFRAWLGMSQ